MPILLLFFSLLSHANDTSSEQYCFPTPSKSQIALSRIKTIQVPSDVINQDGNCLVIQMSPHRRELIQRFILNNFPEAKIQFSSEEIIREPCSIMVKKIKNISKNENTIDISKYPNANTQSQKGLSEETMQIQTLKDFELNVNLDTIKGSCRYINPNRYEITLEVTKEAKSVIPKDLPPGSIVVINTPPPSQETMHLKTQLQLNRGEQIEIGEVIRTMKQKNTLLDSRPKLDSETLGQGITEKVFLSFQ